MIDVRTAGGFRTCIVPNTGLAVLWGILGLRHVKVKPEDKGASHAVTGIVLGAVEMLANWLGLGLILVGLAELIG